MLRSGSWQTLVELLRGAVLLGTFGICRARYGHCDALRSTEKLRRRWFLNIRETLVSVRSVPQGLPAVCHLRTNGSTHARSWSRVASCEVWLRYNSSRYPKPPRRRIQKTSGSLETAHLWAQPQLKGRRRDSASVDRVHRSVSFREPENDSMLPCSVSGPLPHISTDGIGTPDPDPRHLVNWCF